MPLVDGSTDDEEKRMKLALELLAAEAAEHQAKPYVPTASMPPVVLVRKPEAGAYEAIA